MITNRLWLHTQNEYHTTMDVMVLKTTKHFILSTVRIDSSCKYALAYHLFALSSTGEIIPAILGTNLPGFWAEAG